MSSQTIIEENVQPNADQDSAWKEILHEYFPAFVQFFFLNIYQEIDWKRGYESLDKELARIRPAYEGGKLFADKLFKIWLRNGKAAWLLVHVEVQDRVTKVFARRMFIYNYRLLDKENHKVDVVSLAVLTGMQRSQTGHYETKRWGCSTVFEFPCARIADFADRWKELEANDNVFAVVVMAQLKAHETRGDNDQRMIWKRHLIFGLYRRGFAKEQVINLFRFIEWVMTLPPKLEQRLQQEIYDYEESNKMPYLARFERVAMQQGLERMRDLTFRQLESKVGTLAERLQKQLDKLSFEQVEQLGMALLDFQSKTDLTNWLKTHPPQNGHARKTAKAA